MNQEYYIGQIFEGSYPPDAAVWCNRNNAFIDKIEPIEKEIEETYIDVESVEKEVFVDDSEQPEIIVEEVPVEKTCMVVKTLNRYEIKEVPAPSEEEIKQQRITELKAELDSTDYVVIKIAEADTIEEQNMLREHYSEIIINRKSWREEINSLEQ